MNDKQLWQLVQDAEQVLEHPYVFSRLGGNIVVEITSAIDAVKFYNKYKDSLCKWYVRDITGKISYNTDMRTIRWLDVD